MGIQRITTAIYPNRVIDKEKLELDLGLDEFGDNTTYFYTKNGTLFAVGYIRIVYGDHGPYVEFNVINIRSELRRKSYKPFDPASFYDWLVPVNDSSLKVYDQKRDVRYLKNPPEGGFKGNREEGYADYKVGMFYVNPYEFGKVDILKKKN
jgi:hypothetical protein